ncbi:MAG: rhamnosyltransferase [Mesorhizobium amorphae]|nr:MAG: rhamnosyltransferase [Mesorhizobium amorphae]
MTRSTVLCAVTAFQPEAELLDKLLATLLDDGSSVAILVDGPVGTAIDEDLLRRLETEPRLDVLRSESNRGVGCALNRLAHHARNRGCSHVLFFDQDSGPPRGLAQDLLGVFEALVSAGLHPAVVGALPIRPGGEDANQPPRYKVRGATALEGVFATDFVITSGSLVGLSALDAVGPFREDYHIDAIDTEWCFRAIERGFGVFVAGDVAMPHRVGHGTVRVGPLRFPLQSQERMLTYIRNQAHSLRLSHVPWRWKLRVAVYLPLQSASWLLTGHGDRRSPARFLKAFVDGLRGRFG